MSALDIFLLPGKFLLGNLLGVFNVSLAQTEPLLFTIIAGFIAWMIWIVLIKAAWFVTLRLLGLA